MEYNKFNYDKLFPSFFSVTQFLEKKILLKILLVFSIFIMIMSQLFQSLHFLPSSHTVRPSSWQPSFSNHPAIKWKDIADYS